MKFTLRSEVGISSLMLEIILILAECDDEFVSNNNDHDGDNGNINSNNKLWIV
jgi:hypothetical protein